MNKFMEIAIKSGKESIESGDGGPFGAVIVLDGKVISTGRNMVLKTNDPTMHAEIAAIREATQLLGRYDLSDCEMYATCEPCLMCLSAIYWSRISKVFYGCKKEDAAQIGFDDEKLYNSILNGNSDIKLLNIDYEHCMTLFDAWDKKEDKAMY